jgi:hypothetical protein
MSFLYFSKGFEIISFQQAFPTVLISDVKKLYLKSSLLKSSVQNCITLATTLNFTYTSLYQSILKFIMADSPEGTVTIHLDIDEEDTIENEDSLLAQLDHMIEETKGLSRRVSLVGTGEDAQSDDDEPPMLRVLPLPNDGIMDDEYMTGGLPIPSDGIQDDDYIIDVNLEANPRYREMVEHSRWEAREMPDHSREEAVWNGSVSSVGSGFDTSSVEDLEHEGSVEPEQLVDNSTKGKAADRRRVVNGINDLESAQSPSSGLAISNNTRKVAERKIRKYSWEISETSPTPRHTGSPSNDATNRTSFGSNEGSSSRDPGRARGRVVPSSRTSAELRESSLSPKKQIVSPKLSPTKQHRRLTSYNPSGQELVSSEATLAPRPWRASSLSGNLESTRIARQHIPRAQKLHQHGREQFVDPGFPPRSIAPSTTSDQYVSRLPRSCSQSSSLAEEEAPERSYSADMSGETYSDLSLSAHSLRSPPTVPDQANKVHPLTRAKVYLDAAVIQAHFAYNEIKEIKKKSAELEKGIRLLEREREMFRLMKKGGAMSARSWSTNSKESSNKTDSTLGWDNISDLGKSPPKQAAASSTKSSRTSGKGRKGSTLTPLIWQSIPTL